MRRAFFIYPALLAGILALHGCAWFGKGQQPTLPSQPAKQALLALKTWKLEGRIGVQTREDGWSANLFWEHEGGQERLRISGPFSQGMVSIIVQKDLIYINEGHGAAQSSTDPEALLQARLGFAVPLRSLRYWVLGAPNPETPFTPLTGAGFAQEGWRLAFQEFIQQDGLELPRKFSVANPSVKLKLIVDAWSVKP
jgi:outer membrane lipoprotein LolB